MIKVAMVSTPFMVKGPIEALETSYTQTHKNQHTKPNNLLKRSVFSHCKHLLSFGLATQIKLKPYLSIQAYCSPILCPGCLPLWYVMVALLACLLWWRVPAM